MASQIKGLAQFIADLRATNTQEAERARVQVELSSLRKKLQSSKAAKDAGTKSKTGYEFRKAVSKLLYIYILGYDVDLGSDEIAALLRMPRFAEKQIGYLALSLLLHARADLQGHVEPIVYDDLRSSKEVLTSIALNYVSTWDTAEAITEELVDLVFQLMVSPTSSPAVRKKASLTLLSFYRLDAPQFTSRPEWVEWIERISALLSSTDLGVATSVASLLTEIAKREPHSIPPATFRAVVRNLSDMFDDTGAQATPADYIYYSMSAPWLVAKLCALLTYLPNTIEDPQNQDEIQEARDCVSHILTTCINDQASPAGAGGQQHANARNMVFFAAVKLGNHLDMTKWGHSLSGTVLEDLERSLRDKETNTRYLALESLRTFPSVPTTAGFEDLIGVVLQLVKDRDISVRRQALDTLYKICDSSNVERVAAELLDLLIASDLQIRPQMVSRLAALIERFATSHAWYFDTCTSLLLIGGVYVEDEVWQRLAQVVVNNESLQPYAVEHIYETLTSSNERSRRYSDALVKVSAFILGEFAPKFRGDVLSLLVVLQDCIGSAPWPTKVMLLTAYIKFAAWFPHTRPQIAEAVAVYENSPDVETQQRACEYARLLRPENVALLSDVIDEMPPYGEHSSRQVFSKLGDHKAAQGLQAPLQPVPRTPLVANSTGSSGRNLVLSSSWEFGFRRMLTHSTAVLYQDTLLQVGCRYEFRQHLGFVMLYLKNISGFELTSLTSHITNPMDNDVLSIRVQNQPPSTLAPGQTVEQVILCEAKQPFALTPTCRITYLAGSFAEMSFKLPIVLERFMSPSPIPSEQFGQRWEQAGASSEFTKSFNNFSSSKASKDVTEDAPVVTGLHYGLVETAPQLVSGAGILHTSKAGMFGCLVRLESDATHDKYKVTVRATKKKLVAVVLANNLAQAYQL